MVEKAIGKTEKEWEDEIAELLETETKVTDEKEEKTEADA